VKKCGLLTHLGATFKKDERKRNSFTSTELYNDRCNLHMRIRRAQEAGCIQYGRHRHCKANVYRAKKVTAANISDFNKHATAGQLPENNINLRINFIPPFPAGK